MRSARILGEGTCYYHVMSRVVDRRFIFGQLEKQVFREMMRRQARFAGVEVLTYALLSNHFHILLCVPGPEEIDAAQFHDRLCALYRPGYVRMVMDKLEDYERSGRKDLAEELRARYTVRMNSLPAFMKELKQRFSAWYNRRNQRRGTLWEERYKSVLVEGAGHPLALVAAYVDLNAVRAGLCSEPADYPFCGYGEAVAGSAGARQGLIDLCRCLGPCAGWNEAASTYRMWLLQPESPTGDSSIADQAELSRARVLRIRVRYFSDGVVLGSRQFVERAVDCFRSGFARGPRDGVQAMTGADWGGLCVMRNLRGEILGAPGPG